MDAAAELGRNPVSKHQIQPDYRDEQADAGQDCRTRLARPNSQARTRTGKYEIFIFLVQLTMCRIGNLTPFILTLAICMAIHTYMFRRYFQQAHSIPIVGVGKRGAYQLVHGDMPRQHSFETTLRFTGPVPADSRQ